MTDKELKSAVLRELDADPTVDATHIAVAVGHRAVTLAGHARTYAEKWAAVAATERVHGVRAVADELAVEFSLRGRPDDQSLAEAIGRRLSGDPLIPETVFAEVREGRVILRGTVETAFQKEEAERVVGRIAGIMAISNGVDVDVSAKATEPGRTAQSADRSAAMRDSRS